MLYNCQDQFILSSLHPEEENALHTKCHYISYATSGQIIFYHLGTILNKTSSLHMFYNRQNDRF